MRIATVEVIHAIKIPTGGYLDGETVVDVTWATKGQHEIDADLMEEMGWAAAGYVEPVAINGDSVVWTSCCASHD